MKANIVVESPFKGKISIFIGMIKVYPAMERYIKENDLNDKSALTEIYDIPNKKAIYRMVIKR